MRDHRAPTVRVGGAGLSEPHRKLLADMDRQITARGITPEEFEKRASQELEAVRDRAA